MSRSSSHHALSTTLSATSAHRLESAEVELRVMQQQVQGWLEDLLGKPVPDLWAALGTGVPLCKVLQRLGETVKCREDARVGTFFAMDNVTQFLTVCRARQLIPKHAMFETEDLTDRKNDKQVLLCLLSLAREGISHGLPPPTIMREEMSIRAIQSKSSLTSEDIQKFIREEDEARKELSTSLRSAIQPNPMLAIPKVSEFQDSSVGPSSDSSRSRSRSPGCGHRAQAKVTGSKCTVSSLHAATDEQGQEGKVTLTLDVDYNLVLQGMQQKHNDQVRRMKEDHAAQLEEMEALHRRGMVALQRDLGDKHKEELARREKRFQSQLNELQEKQAAIIQSLKDTHQTHVDELTRSLQQARKEDLSRQKEDYERKIASIANDQKKMNESHAQAIEELRNELRRDEMERLERLQRQHEAQVAALGQQHAAQMREESARLQKERELDECRQQSEHRQQLESAGAHHLRQLETLKREKESQLDTLRENTAEERRNLEQQHRVTMERLRTTHLQEMRELHEEYETAVAQKDSERKKQLEAQRKHLEEQQRKLSQDKQHEHEIQMQALRAEGEAKLAASEARWAETRQQLQTEMEKERARLGEAARCQAAQQETLRADLEVRHAREKEELARKYAELLSEAERGFRESLDAAVSRERKEYASTLAELRAAHAETLHQQAIHQRQQLESTIHQAAQETQFLLGCRGAEHRAVVCALKFEHATCPQRAYLEGAGQAGTCNKLLEQHLSTADGCKDAAAQGAAMQPLIAAKLAAPEYTGIHLYHCQPRGSFFLRKGVICTPEFFVRLFGDSLMAFINGWVDLDAFIATTFGLGKEEAKPKQTYAYSLDVESHLTCVHTENKSFWADP